MIGTQREFVPKRERDQLDVRGRHALPRVIEKNIIEEAGSITFAKIVPGKCATVAHACCVEGTGGQPSAARSPDLSSFDGARAGQAGLGLRNRGCDLIRNKGLTACWFDRSTGACAEIASSNGRYSSVGIVPAEERRV